MAIKKAKQELGLILPDEPVEETKRYRRKNSFVKKRNRTVTKPKSEPLVNLIIN